MSASDYEQLSRAVVRLRSDPDFTLVIDHLNDRLEQRGAELVATNDEKFLLRLQGAARELADVLATLRA